MDKPVKLFSESLHKIACKLMISEEIDQKSVVPKGVLEEYKNNIDRMPPNKNKSSNFELGEFHVNFIARIFTKRLKENIPFVSYFRQPLKYNAKY